MATTNITIPDAKVDTLARSWGYQATINGEPNPQTKGAFCKQQIVNLLKERIRVQEQQDAIAAANISDADIN